MEKEMGAYLHDCDSFHVFELTHANKNVPHFNAQVYLKTENELSSIGKVEEVIGTVHASVMLH